MKNHAKVAAIKSVSKSKHSVKKASKSAVASAKTEVATHFLIVVALIVIHRSETNLGKL